MNAGCNRLQDSILKAPQRLDNLSKSMLSTKSSPSATGYQRGEKTKAASLVEMQLYLEGYDEVNDGQRPQRSHSEAYCTHWRWCGNASTSFSLDQCWQIMPCIIHSAGRLVLQDEWEYQSLPEHKSYFLRRSPGVQEAFETGKHNVAPAEVVAAASSPSWSRPRMPKGTTRRSKRTLKCRASNYSRSSGARYQPWL